MNAPSPLVGGCVRRRLRIVGKGGLGKNGQGFCIKVQNYEGFKYIFIIAHLYGSIDQVLD